MEVYGLTDDQKADRTLPASEIGSLPSSARTSRAAQSTRTPFFLCQLPEDVRVQVVALDDLL